MGFQKLKPQVDRNYKNCNNDRFQANIKTCGLYLKDTNSFMETILSPFNKYAPIKKNIFQQMRLLLLQKNSIKALKWSKLRNKYLKSKCLTDKTTEKTTIYNIIFVRNF